MEKLEDLCATDIEVHQFATLLEPFTDEAFKQLIGRDDLSPEFLHAAFFCVDALTDGVRSAFACHLNSPDSVLLMCLKYFPGWVEDSPAVALRRLGNLGSDKSIWDDKVASYIRDGYNASVYKKQWNHWLPFLKIDAKSTKAYWSNERKIGKILASRVIKAILDRGYKDDLHDVTGSLVKEKHEVLVAHSNFRVRLFAIAQLNLSNTHLEQLALDKTASVRKKLAARKDLTEVTVKRLLDANDSAVDAVLAANKHLDRSMQACITEAREEKVETADGQASPVPEALAILKAPDLSKALLMAHAKHPNPVVRCVTAMHMAAGKEVIELLLADSVEWVKAPIASRTRDVDVMKTLSDSPHIDVIRHLANNENLPVEIAIKLLEKHNDQQVRLGLAAVHVHDTRFMQALRDTRESAEDWELDLDIALDETTKKPVLSKMHNNKARNELCISRAIARHKNCPPTYLEKFVHYLPQDAKANPVNVLAALEGKKIYSDYFSDWSIERRIRDGSAHAFMTHAICKGKSTEMQRLVPWCRAVHLPLLDRIALNDDDVLQKRLAECKPMTQSRFILESLSYSKRVPIRKALLKHDDLPADIVQRLCADPDKSVRLVASQLAKKIGLSVEKSETQAVSKGGSLGNKAARLELAKNTDDLKVVQRLVGDKLVDVRRAVVKRVDLTASMMLQLCGDVDSEVAVAAIELISDKKLDMAQDTQLQALFTKALSNQESSRALKSLCIKGLDDKSLVNELYLKQELNDLRSLVAEHTSSGDLIDQLIFDFSREKRGSSEIGVLVHNPIISRDQAKQVVGLSTIRKGYLLSRLRDASTVLELVREMDAQKALADEVGVFEADFTADQLRELLDIDKSYFRFLPTQTHKLEDEEVLSTLKSFSEKLLKRLCSAPGWQEPVHSWLFTWAFASSEISCEDKEVYGALDSFVSEQILSVQQMHQVSAHADAVARENLVSYQGDQMTEELLLLFAGDKEVEVRRAVEYLSCNMEDFPASVLQVLAEDADKEIRNDARRSLRQLGVDIKNSPGRDRVTKSISHLLKKSEAPFGAVKANRKLLELGILEECQRESSAKPGEMRTFKKLTESGENYGVNKFNQYGDAAVEYYVEEFPELLKKIA